MGEIVVKEEAELRQKKKKKGLPGIAKFFITIGIIFILIPGILVGVIFALFYDGSHTEINVREDQNTTQVFMAAVADSLDNTTTTKKMHIGVSDTKMNQLLKTVLNEKPEVKEYVNNFYVDANDSHYDFNIELNAKNIFKTRVIISTESEFSDDLITFKINDIKVGRIGGFTGLSGLIGNFVSDATINDALQGTGLHLNVSLKDLKITYAMEDFQNDLKGMLSIIGSYGAVFDEIISDSNIRTIGASGDDLFYLDINLDKMKITSATHGVENYTVKAGYYNTFINDLKSDMLSLLNNSKIQEGDINPVSAYLLGGESVLEASEIATINNYKAVNAFDGYAHAATPYYDFDTDVSDELRTKVKSQITEAKVVEMATFGTPIEVKLTSSDIENMFKTASVFAKIINFVTDESEQNGVKAYKDNYIMFDRASVIMNGDKIYFIVSINFNGETTHMSIEATKKASTSFAEMKFEINRILLGDKAVKENTKETFLDLIKSALNCDAFNDVFSINNNEISFNLSTILSEYALINDTTTTVDFGLVSTTSALDGEIAITLNKKI